MSLDDAVTVLPNLTQELSDKKASYFAREVESIVEDRIREFIPFQHYTMQDRQNLIERQYPSIPHLEDNNKLRKHRNGNLMKRTVIILETRVAQTLIRDTRNENCPISSWTANCNA